MLNVIIRLTNSALLSVKGRKFMQYEKVLANALRTRRAHHLLDYFQEEYQNLHKKDNIPKSPNKPQVTHQHHT